jgi:transcriptional regulator with XRE-family HTH domain
VAEQKLDIYGFIGTRIGKMRKERGLTLEELAGAAGMNTSFLQSIEKNKKRPSVRMLYNICLALDIPMEKMFKDAPAPPKETDVFARKISMLVRDASPKTREKALEVLKTLIRAD